MTRCDECGKDISECHDAILINDYKGEKLFIICKECYQRINEWLNWIWRSRKTLEYL